MDLTTGRPNKAARAAYTQCAAALLQAFPLDCPPLLFGQGRVTDGVTKPFSYLFIHLLLIDIRSSFPSLLSKLNSAEYLDISKRLAAAFDVISSFVGFLVRSLDNDDDPRSSSSMVMSPDLLLKLRKDIAETMSLAIEYMRDRWDSAIAGAKGLHSSARTAAAVTSEGSRLTLTWESMKDDVSADGLILAATRALAIWLSEDENENLRSESAGLTDMFIELYQTSRQGELDFRYPILTAFEATVCTDDGFMSFMEQKGWEALAADLVSIIRSLDLREPHRAADATLGSLNLITGENARGIEIVRVLLAVLDNGTTGEPREEAWSPLVKATASMRPVTSLIDPIEIELRIALLQLSAALLTAVGNPQRYRSSISSMLGSVNQVRNAVQPVGGDALGGDFQEALQDVVMSIENLR